MSGLKANDEKTQVVWIGSKINCRVRFLRDMNFCWVPGMFKVLGIKCCTDTDRSIVQVKMSNRVVAVLCVVRGNHWKYFTPVVLPHCQKGIEFKSKEKTLEGRRQLERFHEHSRSCTPTRSLSHYLQTGSDA